MSSDSKIVFLTGAGNSAESGIPTFRGEDGYWRVGSRNYHPQELATYAAWRKMPEELWAWYLFRRSQCRAAKPNAAHDALARLEATVGNRFRLVTQNVDGLHIAAGNSLERTYQIHGNIQFMRCSDECNPAIVPLPQGFEDWPKDRKLTEPERAILRCAQCGALTRPHVLWFDEMYDEERYRWESSVMAAEEASVLVIVGTSGATTLPIRMAQIAMRRNIRVVVVNKDPSTFTEMADSAPNGLVLWGSAGEHVPRLVDELMAPGG